MSAAFHFDCLACGTTLSFSPGQFEAWCSTCEAARPLPAKFPKELGFESLPDTGPLTLGAADGPQAKCSSCRAVLSSTQPLERCSFCGGGLSPLPVHGTPIPAQGWLPPRLGTEAARKALWTACKALGVAAKPASMRLVLVPWASMRFETHAAYEGERGDRIHREHGPDTIDWQPVSGVVIHPVINTGTLCSRGLPPRVARAMQEWDWPFSEAAPIQLPRPAETYATDSEALTHFVVPDLDQTIDQLVLDDIGGDEQRIHALDVERRHRGLRLVWAPVWTGKLAHMDLVFAVNARSGNVVIETFEDATRSRDDADIDEGLFSNMGRERRNAVFAAVAVGLLLLAAYAIAAS